MAELIGLGSAEFADMRKEAKAQILRAYLAQKIQVQCFVFGFGPADHDVFAATSSLVQFI